MQTNRTINTEDGAALCWLLQCYVGGKGEGHMCPFMLSHHSLTLKKLSKDISTDIGYFGQNIGYLEAYFTHQYNDKTKLV